MLVEILLLVGGFVLLIGGAEYLVRGASALAKRLELSELVIGLTVVAFGTSAPELIVGIVAAADGQGAVVFGNVIGSNMFNTLAVLGCAGLFLPVAIQRNSVRREMPFMLLIVLLLWLLVNDRILAGSEPVLSRFNAAVLLLFFGLFFVYVYYLARRGDETVTEKIEMMRTVPMLLAIIGGLGGLVLGGRLVVDNAVLIARTLGVSEKLIALTIVAVGTSLPELVTSVVAAVRGKADIAAGNIIGSNIFNFLLIVGVSGMIRPVAYDPVLNTDLYLLAAATVLLFAFMFTGKRYRIDRWEAGLLLAAYIGYTVFLIGRR